MDSQKSIPPDAAESAANFNAAHWLAAIIESSDDAIIGKSLDGNITSWNAGAERMFGYRADEVIGKPITILIPQNLWHEETRILKRLRNGERVDHFETTRLRKDGNTIAISLTISPIRDAAGAITGISKIARDVTEHKKLLAREAASRVEMLAERKFRELIENAPDAILQVDSMGQIVLANRTAELVFGYSRDELIGMSVDALVPEAARSRHPTRWRRVSGGDQPQPQSHRGRHQYYSRRSGCHRAKAG
jgi:PAS domain S-box-containing protein